jgi:hypothetical protein
MDVGGTRERPGPELRGFGVLASVGGAVARSRALKFLEVISIASTPPPEGGTRALERQRAWEGESPSLAELPASS